MVVGVMGKVFRPEEIVRGRKMAIEEAIRDLSPGIREATGKILDSWVGEESEERLRKLLGEEEAKRLIKRIKEM
jgi:vacuolar-type H+-ATPase subunit E/Vma4